ncbi:MAG: hypothetical protein ACPG7F_15710, partial [Aggregatilineales bacterium]
PLPGVEKVDLQQLLPILFLVLCILPIVSMIVIFGIVFWLGKRQFENLTAPNTEKMLAKYQQMRDKDPQADPEALVRKVINEQAFKAGLVGLITGLGGVFTLPIALPIDLLLSVRIQATMVNFIAQVYGMDSAMDNKVATYMVMSGSGEVTQMSTKFIMRYALRIMGKSFSKFIPFIGAIISFAVNYFITRSMGRMAMGWYHRRYVETVTA